MKTTNEFFMRLFFGRSGHVTKPRGFVWWLAAWFAWIFLKRVPKPGAFSATWRILREVELKAKIEVAKRIEKQNLN